MTAEEIKEGDIVEIEYITEFTKEHINEGKALVIWKGYNHQPLVRRLNTKTTVWTCYKHIARVVGHIDIEGYMDKALEQQLCEDCISRNELKRVISELTYWHPTTDGRLEVGGAFEKTVYKVEDVWRLTRELPPVTPKLQEWLSSFNTDSATECFTAVQELKKEIENECIGKE